METAEKPILYPVPKDRDEKNIPGGFYIKARKIESSEIAHAAPVVREVWDWLLRQCNHREHNGIKRGQCVRRLADIQEGLHWYVGYRKMTYSKSQCEGACEWLRERAMITTTKTTRGLIITVCNYDSYNRIENYEANNENATKPTRSQQPADTINKNVKNVKNEIVGSGAGAPEQKTFKQWTDEDFRKELEPYLPTYGKDVLNPFYKYWSEKSATGKMRLQLERTWETKKRLETWQRRNEEKR